VTLEGPEGSGKTTQAARLAEVARSAGLEVVLTREPGGTPLGEAVRAVLLHPREGTTIDARADALLFNAARAELVSEVIVPALERGALVVCARFADSTVAYQGHGRGLDVSELRAVERFATGGVRPDLTIVLDLPVEAGLARKGADETTRFETLDLAFHERVRRGFLTLAAAEPDRVAVIDARQPTDAVTDAIVARVGTVPGMPDLARGRRPLIPTASADG
jgi:dTMP kinase